MREDVPLGRVSNVPCTGALFIPASLSVGVFRSVLWREDSFPPVPRVGAEFGERTLLAFCVVVGVSRPCIFHAFGIVLPVVSGRWEDVRLKLHDQRNGVGGLQGQFVCSCVL